MFPLSEFGASLIITTVKSERKIDSWIISVWQFLFTIILPFPDCSMNSRDLNANKLLEIKLELTRRFWNLYLSRDLMVRDIWTQQIESNLNSIHWNYSGSICLFFHHQQVAKFNEAGQVCAVNQSELRTAFPRFKVNKTIIIIIVHSSLCPLWMECEWFSNHILSNLWPAINYASQQHQTAAAAAGNWWWWGGGGW